MRSTSSTSREVPSSRRAKVLVVDDDDAIRVGLGRFLASRGFEVDQVDRWSVVRARFESFRPDAIVMDHVLGDGEGVALLSELRGFAPTIPVVILTGHGSIDLAVQAMLSGAEHFLTKPVELEALAKIVRAATDRGGVARESNGKIRLPAKPSSGGSGGRDPFLGSSDAIKRLRAQAERIRGGDRPVLILGETGSGKSVLARWLHETGPRAAGRFVDLNCAALSRELLDSELFGHERGAFTGAQGTKVGLLEAAHEGTLFLDEIGDMDVAIQPKLLKALEEKKFRRLGDVRDRSVDVRLVSATHQDLGASVRDKTFRADLYYRISALHLTMPSLRSRSEDVPLVARDLISQLCAELGRPPAQLTVEAEAMLAAHPWPGNVRELKNVLDRALCLVEGDVIAARDLAFDDLHSSRAESSGKITLKEAEVQMIERVLREEGGKVDAAAQRLGVPRSSLYHKLKALGLKPSKT